jgi:hypothetical protein
MPRFNSLQEIISHIEGKYTDMIYVGKDYTIADLVGDLQSIAAKIGTPIGHQGIWQRIRPTKVVPVSSQSAWPRYVPIKE